MDQQAGLLRVTKAAEYLSVSVSTLANWRASGTGPTYCLLPTGRIAYARTDLDAYIEKHRQPVKSV